MFKRRLFLRILGGLFIIIGAYLWFTDDRSFSLNIFSFTIEIPIYFFVATLGLFLVWEPSLIFDFLGNTFNSEKILSFAQRIGVFGLTEENPTPVQLAKSLKRQVSIDNSKTVFFVLILVFGMFSFVPKIVSDKISDDDFKDNSKQLVTLIQESRVDFDSADMFRRFILNNKNILSSEKYSSSDTGKLFSYLERLFSPEISDQRKFDEILAREIYGEIKEKVNADTQLIESGLFEIPKCLNDPVEMRSTLLTFFAIVCQKQGKHGKHLDPYIYARQLLNIAFKELPQNAKAPATYNAMGVNYASTFKSYGQYLERFSRNEPMRTKFCDAIGEKKALTRLQLVRKSLMYFEQAFKQSTNNMMEARYRNNHTDMMIEILSSAHLDNINYFKEITDREDEIFLEKHVARHGNKETLSRILEELTTEVNIALKLSKEPEIFYTRAQLYSVGYKINVSQSLKIQPWANETWVLNKIHDDLQIAKSLGLQEELFNIDALKRLHVVSDRPLL